MQDRPRVATLVSSLANYSATMDTPEDPDANPDAKATSGKPAPKLGTLAGVYFPCMQNIFGVILFIRLTWVIGTAGVIQSFFIIFMCCSCVSLPSLPSCASFYLAVVSAVWQLIDIVQVDENDDGGSGGHFFFGCTTPSLSLAEFGCIPIDPCEIAVTRPSPTAIGIPCPNHLRVNSPPDL